MRYTSTFKLIFTLVIVVVCITNTCAQQNVNMPPPPKDQEAPPSIRPPRDDVPPGHDRSLLISLLLECDTSFHFKRSEVGKNVQYSAIGVNGSHVEILCTPNGKIVKQAKWTMIFSPDWPERSTAYQRAAFFAKTIAGKVGEAWYYKQIALIVDPKLTVSTSKKTLYNSFYFAYSLAQNGFSLIINNNN